MMLKLATVFSGIGAIEQALKRLHINHEIIFACDNGEVQIDVDTDSELEKIKSLDNPKEKLKYVKDLYSSKSKRKNFVEESYLANYSIKNNLFFEDVKLLDGTDFINKVDLFVGGSPCQSFSIAGVHIYPPQSPRSPDDIFSITAPCASYKPAKDIP